MSIRPLFAIFIIIAMMIDVVFVIHTFDDRKSEISEQIATVSVPENNPPATKTPIPPKEEPEIDPIFDPPKIPDPDAISYKVIEVYGKLYLIFKSSTGSIAAVEFIPPKVGNIQEFNPPELDTTDDKNSQ